MLTARSVLLACATVACGVALSVLRLPASSGLSRGAVVRSPRSPLSPLGGQGRRPGTARGGGRRGGFPRVVLVRASSPQEEEEAKQQEAETQASANTAPPPEDDVAAELRRQAAALREEAERLESAMASERAAALKSELEEFFAAADANKDGVVTLDELRAALRTKLVDDAESPRAATRARELLASEERVKAILDELDKNADGVLQIDEMVSVASFKDKLESKFREARAEKTRETVAASAKSNAEALATERLEIFESVRNSTNVTARLAAAVAYALPLLDAIPIDAILSVPPTPLTAVLAGAYAAYRAVPAGGLLVFLVLNFLAGNVAAPRLPRFAARHAIIMDIIAAFLLPLAYRFLPAPFDVATALVFEAAVISCVLAALFLGKDGDFIPGTGQLTKKFTDDFEDSVRLLIRTLTASDGGPPGFVGNLGPDNVLVIEIGEENEEDDGNTTTTATKEPPLVSSSSQQPPGTTATTTTATTEGDAAAEETTSPQQHNDPPEETMIKK